MRLLLFFFSLPVLLSAQSDFLKNPDIVWAVEIEQDWVVDIPSLEEEWEEGVITLKQFRTKKNEMHWSSPYLADLVFQAMVEEQISVFKDPACTIRVDFSQVLPQRDTIITFDPETYEERVKVYYYEPQPLYDFKAWRLRQTLAYDKKNATWSTTAEAIAPLFVIKNARGDSLGVRPICWFRPDNKRPKLHSDRIIWAKKTFSGKQPKTKVPPNPANPIKAMNGFQNPLSHLFRVLETNMKSPFYDSWGAELLTPNERKNMLSKIDTIFSWYPETYEEEIKIVHKEINTDSIRQLRLVQTWYWDERRHRLSICLDAVAPMVDVFSSSGNFRYSMPLFYRRAKR